MRIQISSINTRTEPGLRVNQSLGSYQLQERKKTRVYPVTNLLVPRYTFGFLHGIFVQGRDSPALAFLSYFYPRSIFLFETKRRARTRSRYRASDPSSIIIRRYKLGITPFDYISSLFSRAFHASGVLSVCLNNRTPMLSPINRRKCRAIAAGEVYTRD